MNFFFKILFVFIIFLFGCIVSGLYFYLCEASSSSFIFEAILNPIATVISIALALVSLIYTFYSTKVMATTTEDMKRTLEEIKHQNKSLIDKINSDLISKNFNENNINDLLKKNKKLN